MPFDAGDIQATLTVDKDPFDEALEQAKADARDFEDTPIAAKLDADPEEFDAALDDAEERLDRLDGDRAEPTLDADAYALDGALDDAEERLGALDDETVTPTLDADEAPFDAKADDAEARLADLDGQRAEPTIDADDTDADVKVEDVEERLDRLSTMVASAKVDVDDRAAKAKLDELEAELIAYRNEVINPTLSDGRLGEIDSELEGYEQRINGATEATQGLSAASKDAESSTVSMGQAAMAMAPALLDIGAYLGAGLVSFGAMAATAAVGLGAFALAAEGDLKQVEGTVEGLLHQFQALNAPIVAPAIAGIVPVISGLFTDIEPLVENTADALVRFETVAAAALGAPYWQTFFGFLGGQASGAIDTFANLIAGAGTALSGLDEVFAPVVANVEQGLDQLAVDMDAFGHTAMGNSGLRSFVDFLVSQSTPVGNTLHQIGADVLGLIPPLMRLAPPMIDVIHWTADLVGALEHLGGGWVITAAAGVYALATAYKALSPALSAVANVARDLPNLAALLAGDEGVSAAGGLGRAVDSMGNAVGDLSFRIAGTTPVVDAFAAASGDAGERAAAGAAGLDSFAEAEANVATGAAGAEGEVAALGETAGTAGAEAADAGVGFSGMLGPIGLALAGITAVIIALVNQSSAAQKAGATYANAYVTQLESGNRPLSQQIALMQQTVNALDAQDAAYKRSLNAYNTLTNQNSSANIGLASADAYTAALQRNQGVVGSLSNHLQELRTQLSATNALNRQAASDASEAATAQLRNAGALTFATAASLDTKAAADALTKAMQAVGASASSSSSDVTDLSSALTVFTGNGLSAQSAILSAQQDVNSFATAVKAAGGNLNGYSSSSLSAASAAVTVSQAVNTVVEQMAAAGRTTSATQAVVESIVGRFDAAAGAAGLNAAQVAALNRQYGLTPRDVSTDIRLEGASGVIGQAQAARAALLQAAQNYTATINILVRETADPGTATRIRGYASGATSVAGGWALVGEKGPELVNLPHQAAVVPAHITSTMLPAANRLPKFASGTTHTVGGGGLTFVDNFAVDVAAGRGYAYGGGGVTVTINVDARGSSDPATVARQIKIGAEQACDKMVGAIEGAFLRGAGRRLT